MSKCYASAIIKIALSEVGYLEKKTKSSLDSDTKNAGYNNFTKYARDLDEIKGFYNGKKNGYEWCAVFVDWCFVVAFGVSAAKKLTNHTIYGASCTQSAKQYKSKNRLFSYPKIGDEIFFSDGAGGCSHTGLVYAVDSASVYTVEGNTSSQFGVVSNGGAVAKKKYALNNYKIYGYGRPSYDAEPSSAKKYQGKFPKLPKRGYFKKGDCGSEVRSLQALLNWLGYKIAIDGDFGEKTEASVKSYQKLYKLEVDGLFGKASLAKAKRIKK